MALAHYTFLAALKQRGGRFCLTPLWLPKPAAGNESSGTVYTHSGFAVQLLLILQVSVIPPIILQGEQRLVLGPAALDQRAGACALGPLSRADLAVAFLQLSVLS